MFVEFCFETKVPGDVAISELLSSSLTQSRSLQLHFSDENENVLAVTECSLNFQVKIRRFLCSTMFSAYRNVTEAVLRMEAVNTLMLYSSMSCRHF